MDDAFDLGELELHEPEHINQVFTALKDTVKDVSGTEGLTKAQNYTLGVLRSSGAISYNESIAGVEGFFSGLKEGVKKTIDYIIRMFTHIYSFFFGSANSSKPGTPAEVAGVVETNNQNLKAVVSPASPEKVDRQIIRTQEDLDRFMAGSTRTTTANAPSSSDQKEAEELKVKLSEAKALPPPQKVLVVKEVIERFVKINHRTQKALDDLCEEAVAEAQAYKQLGIDDSTLAFAATPYYKMYSEYQVKAANNARHFDVDLIRIPKGLRTLHDAERAQETLAEVIKGLEAESKSISEGIKRDVVKLVKELEAKANQNQDPVVEAKFKKDLESCRIIMQITTKVIKKIQSVCNNVRRISNMINRLFSVITG